MYTRRFAFISKSLPYLIYVGRPHRESNICYGLIMKLVVDMTSKFRKCARRTDLVIEISCVMHLSSRKCFYINLIVNKWCPTFVTADRGGGCRRIFRIDKWGLGKVIPSVMLTTFAYDYYLGADVLLIYTNLFKSCACLRLFG